MCNKLGHFPGHGCQKYGRREELTMITSILGTGLGGEGESHILAAWFTNDDLLLVNSVGSISKLGNIEALVLNLVLALNLGDLNSLGDTDLLGGRVGKGASDFKGGSNKRDLVSLSLVFFTAYLVFSMTISWRSVSSSSTSCYFHSFRLLLVSNLSGGARSCYILPLVLIGTDLSLNGGGCFLTDSKDTVKAVVIVHNLLDCKSDWGHLLSEGRHADLGIDRGVGVPAVKLRGIPVGRGVHICGGNSDKSRNKYQHHVDGWGV